jgi:HEAT repeat protein
MAFKIHRPWSGLIIGLVCLGLAVGCGKGSRSESTSAPDLIKKLYDPNPEVRAEAAEQLRIRAPEGKEAISRLYELLGDEHERCRSWASDALAAHGELAYPQLTKGVKSESSQVRALSWRALGNMEPNVKRAHAEEFAVFLEDGLKDSETEVRRFAAYAFNRTDMLSPKSVPIAIRALKSGEDKQVLCYILGALTACPENLQRSALPQLRELSNTQDPEVSSLIRGLFRDLGEPVPAAPEKRGGGPRGPQGQSPSAPPAKPGPPDKRDAPDKSPPPTDKNS